MATGYQVLIKKLDEFIRKFYLNRLIRGALYSLTLVLLFFLSVTILEYYSWLNTTARAFIFYSFLASSVFILVKFIAIPLLKLYRLGEVISHKEAAKIIGNHFSNIQDKLLNVLQLNEQYSASSVNSSLIEAGINQKIIELKPVPFASAVDLTQNKKYLRYALPPVLVFLFLLFAAPNIIKDGTKRLVDYSTYYEKPAPFQFVVLNDELRTMQQEDFLIKIKVEGEQIPDNAYIEINDTRFKLEKDGKIRFEYLFRNVQQDTRFRFLADEFFSKEYTLSVLPNPIILDFETELIYPSYIGKKNETINNTGDLIIPAGTKVKWVFNTRSTNQLSLSFIDTTYHLEPVALNKYQYSQKFLGNNIYSIKSSNEHFKSKDSVIYDIRVIPDEYPIIEVHERADSLSSKRLYFRGSVKDDYGLKRLSFNYKFLHSDSAKTNIVHIPFNKSALQDQFFHFWDLSSINLNPGDEIEYFFEVWDNDGVNGSKASRTEKHVFKAPTLKEIAQNTSQKNQEIKKDLQSSLKDAKQLQKEIDDLNKKMLEKKTLGWEEKKKLEELLNKHNNLQKQLENIQLHNEQNIRNQSEYKEIDQKIAEKQEQLQELFENIMSDEMKDMFKQLEKLMEQLDKDKIQETLDKMKFDSKDLEKELDRSLELFKQLEFEQKMQDAIDQLKELSEKQEELSEKSKEKNADSKDLQEKQEELNKEFEEMKKEMDDLEKKNRELERPNEMPDTKEEQKQIEEDMKNSSKELQNNKPKKASEPQKDAAKKMKDLAEKMESMMEGNSSEQEAEDMNALRAILENLVKLSFDQEKLMVDLKQTDRNNPVYQKIAQNQKKLKDDSKIIEDSLFALSKRVPQLSSVVNREISSINMNMDKSISHLAERETPQATSRQQFAMTSINNLALLLSEALKQMQQQMAQQKSGQGSCKKPGSEGQPKPSAANMKKMQQQINQQIQKLKEQMEKEGQQKGGKSPGGNMSQDLAKMAAQQAALRQQLQKLARELNKDGKGGGNNLDKLAKQMEETETDLVNKRITQETIKRQQEILTKLLEAENAEREREFDEQRKSKEAKNENFSNPSDFLEYKRLKEKEAELLKTVPVSLKPFYKSKVSEYFNNIEE
jgi:hypothetical protein